MQKIGKAPNLIGYLALTDETAERAGTPPKSVWRHVFRPRTILYTVLWSGIGVALIVALFMRSPIDVNVTPTRNPLFVTLSDGTIRNTYDLRLRNKQGTEQQFLISLTSGARLNIAVEGRPDTVVTVPANQTLNQRIYVTAPAGTDAALDKRTDLRLWVVDTASNDRVYLNTIFNGRGSQAGG